MLSIAIHISPVSLSIPNTPDIGDSVFTEKINDENHQTNGFSPFLTTDKDIPFASLSTARCGFGITSTNDSIYAVGVFELIIKKIVIRFNLFFRLKVDMIVVIV